MCPRALYEIQQLHVQHKQRVLLAGRQTQAEQWEQC